MDKIKKVTGAGSYDDNYDEDYDDVFDNYDDGSYAGQQNDGQNQQAGNPNSQNNGFVPGNGTGAGGFSLSSTALEMKVVKPEHFDSVTQIADHLLNNRTVVLNLENTNKETARRLIDFLSGVAYSIDGSLKKIASNAYVITPNNVDVGEAQLKGRAQPQAQPEQKEEENDSFGEF